MHAGPHDSLLLMPVYSLMHVLNKRTGPYVYCFENTKLNISFFGLDLTMHAASGPGNSDGIAISSITNTRSSD